MTPETLAADLDQAIGKLAEFQEINHETTIGFREQRRRLLESRLQSVDPQLRARLMAEFDGWGPLENLLNEPDWTEILLNGPASIWIERRGQLTEVPEGFLSVENYQRIMAKLCLEAGCDPNVESPSADGQWRGHRLHITRPPITKTHMAASLRRHPENPWTLQSLQAEGWCSEREAGMLRYLVQSKQNFLVIGSTGCGKTSVINALLKESGHDRSVILEDSDEIALPPGPSLKLLTRKDSQGVLKDVSLTDLLRQSLRLRPDRLVIGEIRGGEAKDFLLALSTGHGGSFGTLHASGAAQALLRLEMLIQMGAPEWSLQTVRRLIHLSLQMIVIVGRDDDGVRRFKGLHRLVSLEESGFLLEPVHCG